jgi:antitoxin VapB
MVLGKTDPKAERRTKKLAQKASDSIAAATDRDPQKNLRQISNSVQKEIMLEELAESRRRFAALPVLDNRTPDEILGYDADGVCATTDDLAQ